MLISCIVSYTIILFTITKPAALIGIWLFMCFWLVWAWRFPGSEAEWERRKKAGQKIGWLK
jgi:hypothetical protein